MIGQLYDLVIDCPDPDRLAAFYRALVGGEVIESDGDWTTLIAANGRRLSFQRVEGFVPPEWPGQDRPQQMHVDVLVADLDVAEPLVLRLGARLLKSHRTGFRVFADLAGHPFCLVDN